MGEAALKRITVDEFLAWDGEGDSRYELIGGQIVATPPPSSFHGAIVVKLGGAISRQLKPPCQVISEAGVVLSWSNDTYYQADLAVTCSPLGRGDWATPSPIVIIEVLSPTTEAHDRGLKLVSYRQIPSVKEIVLIASDERRVELWQRGAVSWTVTDLDADKNLRLESIGFDIPVEALYDGLDFSQGAVAQS